MSGGVGPSKDIGGLHGEEHEQEQQQQPTARKPDGRRWSLGLRHLNCLALCIVLAASGTVSPWDLAFVAFAALYMLFISRASFPPRRPGPEPTVFDRNNRALGLYVQFAAVVGLYLPIAYILEGVYEGDKAGVNAAAPHLFLLAAQVFMEGVAFSGQFSTPVRAFVPVFYNSRRIATIIEWLGNEFGETGEELYGVPRRRLYVGRGLAIANMALWSFNLLGFLVPVYLPRVFKGYYSYPSNKSKD
ncbi:uncharacterized protein LOC116204570 [Punica granatum]|uniref:DUF7733 domain-containing protein n=2 Tax=Punica granatum TaxID=22663 RepID=A0A218XI54_PUNGR|nr:uncharacterized protein LOC116204570 [Punica granatum]OWM84488.1 hypothetical protein CDL15_Pgr000928 [Punica granatum]PKI50735.1 hypothetical protein CRG98_028877 [Punica granatum]